MGSIILFTLIFPLIADPSYTSIAVEILLITSAAVAWNIFSGYTGYVSLGHATYYGIGAYTLALATQNWHIPGGYSPFLLLPLAGLVAGIFSTLLGWIALRTRRYAFMVITVAIFFIFQLLAYNLHDITNGANGIFLPLPMWSDELYNLPFYYVALLLLMLAVFVSWWIRHSRFGLLLLAIGEDEDRVRSLGSRVGYHKFAAYVLSAIFTGMIGALSIYFAGLITPSFAFNQTLDITVVTVTFFGGVGSVSGPIIGGLLLEPLQTYLSQTYGNAATDLNLVLFGCFLLVVILLLPKGIVPSVQKRWSTWRAGREKPESLPALASAHLATATASPALPRSFLDAQAKPLQLASTEAHSTQIAEVQPHFPAAKIIVSRPQPSGGIQSPTLSRSLYKVRSQRLVSGVLNESVAEQGQMLANPTVSWRCPICRKPFLLKLDMCYCPRCGFTRFLTTGK